MITSQNKGLRRLIEEIRKIKEIEEAYTVTGKYDFLIKLRAADIDELQTLLTDRISCIPGVIRHETMIAMTTILDRAEPLLGPNVAGQELAFARDAAPTLEVRPPQEVSGRTHVSRPQSG